MQDFVHDLIIFVPLVGGLVLLASCAQAIIRCPNISNSHAFVLAIGALLCVAPTLASVTFKGAGVEVNVQQQPIKPQNAQLRTTWASRERSSSATLPSCGGSMPCDGP